MWALWITLLIGLWLLFSGFTSSLVVNWNMVIFGIGAIVFGFIAYFANRKNWQGFITGFIGIWLLVSGIWLEFITSWNFLIFGILIAMLSLGGTLSRSHYEPLPE